MSGKMDLEKLRLAIFDLGQVCVRINEDRCRAHWLRLAGRSLEAGLDGFDQATHERFERGEIEAKAFWAALRESMALPLQDEQWLEGWNSIFGDVIEPTQRTIEALKERGRRVVCLSNTNAPHVEVWKPLYAELMLGFSQVYVSNELGMRKPEPRIFRRVLELEGVEPEEAVFFDDRKENVEAARQLGIESHHFTDDEAAWRWWQGVSGTKA